jgi:NHL repeat
MVGGRRVAVVAALCGVLALPSSAGAAWPTITTLAGTGLPGFSGDGGPASLAQVSRPTEAIGLPGGSVLISDYDNDRVRLVGPDGVITTFAGTGVQGFSGDGGPATLAQLSNPRDTIRLPDGSTLVADSTNERIRRVAADGTISTIAGTGGSGSSGDGGPATSATFSGLRDIALLADGSVLLSDQANARLRRIDTGRIVHAHSAGYATPEGIEQLPDGSVLVADRDGQIVRRVAPDGTLSVFAGAPVGQCIDDLAGPQDVAVLPDGSVLIADTFNNRIVRVGPGGGALTVFAGPDALGDCAPGFEGDGGPRLGARFELPEGVSVTPDGSVLVADSLNHRVRVIPRVPPRPETPIVGGPDGREITVPVELAAGATLTGCQVAVRPAGSGAAFVALATSVDPAGECSARPSSQEVPGGSYDLRVQTTDSDADIYEAVFSVRVGPPAPPPAGLVPPPSFFVPCLDDGVLVTELRARRDRRVVVAGVARPALVGHTVDLTADGRHAGSARVGEDGGFTAVLPAPAARRPASVRYRAIVAGARSPALKLRRRMTMSAGARPGDRVSLSGRVRAPLSTRARGAVRLRRYVTCRRARTITSTSRRRGGRFAVPVDRRSRPIVYRATARVPRRAGGNPRFSTFTLFVLVAPRSS